MSDLVERLRANATLLGDDHYSDLMREAAARIEQLEAENTALIKAVAEMAHEDGTNAKRMRAGIVAARKKLAISRFNWTGPILQADNILAQSLTVINDSAALDYRQMEGK